MTLYDILEVSPNASKEVIDKAYKVLAKRYHPDLNPLEHKEQSEEYMRALNKAKEVLTDDVARAQYDLELQEQYNNKKYDKDDTSKDIFRKWPNWLRWILSIPIAYASYVAVKILFSISLKWTLGINSYVLNDIYDATVATFVFIVMFNSIIPKFKFIITVVSSSILGLLYIILGVLSIYKKNYLENSFLLTIVYYLLAVITIIMTCASIYKQNKKKSKE